MKQKKVHRKSSDDGCPVSPTSQSNELFDVTSGQAGINAGIVPSSALRPVPTAVGCHDDNSFCMFAHARRHMTNMADNNRETADDIAADKETKTKADYSGCDTDFILN